MNSESGSRRGRRWLRLLVVAVVGIIILVVLAPTLVSWTFGRGLVASLVSGSVNGDVTVSDVRFGWTAPQRITGLRIDDRVNGNLIDANVEVSRSLFSLITNPLGEHEITASADVTTTQGPDGSLGLAKLMKPSPTPKPPPSALPQSLVVALRLDPSSFTIDQGANGMMTLEGLEGTARFAAADGSVAADMKGRLGSSGAGSAPSASGAGSSASSAAGARGPIALRADLKHVVDANGGVTIGAATGNAQFTARDVVLRYDGAASSLTSLEATIDAVDASKPVAIAFALAGAKRETIDVTELAGRAELGRDPKGPLGLSSSDLTANIERGELAVRGGGEPFSARGLTADVKLGAGGRASFKLAGETAIGSRRGAIAGEGALEHLFDERFGLTLAQTTGSAKVTVERAVVPAGGVLMEIETLVAAIDASNVAQPIQINVDGRGVVREGEGAGASAALASGAPTVPGAPGSSAVPGAPRAVGAGQPTSLIARASLARDPQSTIGISTELRSISGDIDARAVPSAILRPFLPKIAGVAIEPARDIGPVMNLTAKATAGTAAPITASLQAERVNAELTAMVDPESGSVRDGRGRVAATIAPALLANTPVRASAPIAANVTFSSLTLPVKDGAPQLDDATGEITAQVDGPVALQIGADAPTTLARVNASVRTQRLAEGAAVTATALVDDVPAQINADVTGLRGAASPGFTIEALRAKGTAAVGPIDWTRPPALLRTASKKTSDYGLAQTTVTAGFDGGIGAGAAQVRVADGAQGATTSLEWNAARVAVAQTAVDATLTNGILDALSLPDFRLARPATIQATIEPFEIRMPSDPPAQQFMIPDLRVGVRSPEVALASAPGIEQPLTLMNLDSTVQLKIAEEVDVEVAGKMALAEGASIGSASAAGATGAAGRVAGSAASGPFANVAFGFDGTNLAQPSRQWTATVDSKDLEASRLLRVAGIDPAKVPGIAPGDRGPLAFKAASEAGGGLGVEFDTAIGAARGKGAASMRPDGTVAVPGADLSITLDAAKSTAFFATEKDAQGRPLITRASALPITVSLRDVLIPAAGPDGTRPLARAKANATLTTGNLDLEVARLGSARIGAVDGRLTMPGDGRSLEMRTTSSLTTPGTGTNPLTLQATVTNFADAKGEFDMTQLSLAGEARLRGLPVALVDVFMDGDGTYETAIGPQLDVDMTAVRPSRSAGSAVSGTIKSEFLVIDVGQVAIQDGTITIASSAPVTMALIPNETLRQRVLKPINPIFADIRPQPGHPLLFAVNELSLPIDMDLHDFNAHFTLTTGDVELQRSGAILSLMQLVREDDDGIIPGNISPLDVTVTDGRLSYDNFTISMGRIRDTWNQQIFSSGDVNLASTPMYATAINVDYPIAGIGRLAAGATRFDAFFGRVNQALSRLPLVDTNMIRVRATFHGPIEPGRELELAFEPVIVTPPGTNPVQGVIDGIFGDRGILRIPGRGGSEGGSGGTGGGAGGGTGGSGGSTGGTGGTSQPRDPIRGIFDDIFKKKKQ